MAQEREKRAGDIILVNPNDLLFEEGFNVRQAYSGIEDLALSIVNEGQVNNLKVYKVKKGDPRYDENTPKYLVRVGHRRTLAGQRIVNVLGQKDFMLRAEKLSNNDMIANLLLQFNSQSETPLNYVEKGTLIARLRSAKADGERVVTDEDIQNRLGISQPQMYNLLALVNVPESVKTAIVNDEISATTVNQIIRDNSKGSGAKRTVDNDAIEAEVKALVSNAQVSPTKGKKGKKVTSANRGERKQSLASKINELKLQSDNGGVKSEIIANFIEVVNALEEKTVSELLLDYND
jgi:hypothetical protein